VIPELSFHEISQLGIVLTASLAILLIAYVTAISAKDLVRLLISLELMFGAVFLSIIPLFTISVTAAYTVAVLVIFTSSSELLVLITAIILLDRRKRGIQIEKVAVGGDSL
jgi:NADH-quinone oxidoreductase subunit K